MPTDTQMRVILAECYRSAAMSPDLSTQIGSCIVNRQGYIWPTTMACNDYPQGWNVKPEDLERPRKYLLIEHSERNTIYKAAAAGLSLKYCTMYASWAGCADCCRGIVQSGITRLVRHYPPLDAATERWLESVSLGDRILKAGGVDIVDVIGLLPDAPPVLRAGELFYPAGMGSNVAC